MDIKNALTTLLKEAGDAPGAKQSLDTLMSNLQSAKSAGVDMLKESATALEEALVSLAKGELSKDDFEYLVESQKRTVEQQLNTLQIQAQVQSKALLMDAMNIALSVVVKGIRV